MQRPDRSEIEVAIRERKKLRTSIGKQSALRPAQCSQQYALCQALDRGFGSSLSTGP